VYKPGSSSCLLPTYCVITRNQFILLFASLHESMLLFQKSHWEHYLRSQQQFHFTSSVQLLSELQFRNKRCSTLSHHISQIRNCAISAKPFPVAISQTLHPWSQILLGACRNSLRPRLLTFAWTVLKMSVLSCQLARLYWRRFEYSDLCSESWHTRSHVSLSLCHTNVTECLPHRRLEALFLQ
jgi:hypothetical protein